MLDRASTFAKPETVELLKTKFVPVALDQAYQRRQKDDEGDFYRKIAAQGPRDLNQTTQGFYLATSRGDLLLYNNNRDPEKILRLMKEKLTEFASLPSEQQSASPIYLDKPDVRYNPSPPDGGLVIRVRAKILSGYKETSDPMRKIFQSALSRDNLWISKTEHQSIISSVLPDSVVKRIARFHLVDNTRGEPPMWANDEIRNVKVELNDGILTGKVELQNKSGDRGYVASLRGVVESNGRQVTRFDVVCSGEFWGNGPYTKNPPEGKFPLAISFSLADNSDIADKVPPQGSRGWVQGYMEP